MPRCVDSLRIDPLLVVCLLMTITLYQSTMDTDAEPTVRYVTNIFPEDHGWTNRISPEIRFNLSSIRPAGVDILLFSDNYTLIQRSTLDISNSSFRYDMGMELDERSYIWMINITDIDMNIIQAGPFHFSVDRSPPSVPMVKDAAVVGPSSMVIDLSADDDRSGLQSYEVDLFRRDMGQWKLERSVNLTVVPGGSYTIDMEENITSPLYFRCTSTDRAGNKAGPSPMERCDPDLEHGAEIVSGDFTGPNRTADLLLSDPLGICMESVYFRCDVGEGNGTWKRISNHTVVSGSDRAPLSIIVHLQPSDGPMQRNYTLKWMDLAPLPFQKYSRPVQTIYIGTSPEISIEAPEFVQVESVRLTLFIFGHSGTDDIFRVRIKRNRSEWYNLSATSHAITPLQNGWRLDIEENITFGTVVLFHFMVMDKADNTAYTNWSVRATRPPMVSISGPGEERIYHGTLTKFIARSSDPENDTLDHQWTLDDEPVWQGRSYSVVLEPGFHNITVNVTDGAYFDTDTFTLYVDEPTDKYGDGGEEGAFVLILLLVLSAFALALIVTVLYLLVKRRASRRGSVRRIEKVKAKEKKERTVSHMAPDVCEICLEPLEEDERKVECTCGLVFHSGCASRSGTCPSCGRELLI
ncbi:MAG: hypothetical protein R6V01_03675 [Thermoplasmatota archaeon]